MPSTQVLPHDRTPPAISVCIQVRSSLSQAPGQARRCITHDFVRPYHAGHDSLAEKAVPKCSPRFIFARETLFFFINNYNRKNLRLSNSGTSFVQQRLQRSPRLGAPSNRYPKIGLPRVDYSQRRQYFVQITANFEAVFILSNLRIHRSDV